MKTVVRGGIGIFRADIQANQVIDQQIFNGQTSLQPAVQARAGGPIDWLSPFGGTTGDQFLSGAVPVNAQSVQLHAPNVRSRYSLQMSAGAERQFFRNWTVSADYVHWRVYHDWIREDENLHFNPATGYNANPSVAGRPNPKFVNIQRFITPNAADSLYDGLQMGVQHRLPFRSRRALRVAGARRSSVKLHHLRSSLAVRPRWRSVLIWSPPVRSWMYFRLFLHMAERRWILS